MAIWQDPKTGALHDDADGEALKLAAWPSGLTQLTAAQAASAQAAVAQGYPWNGSSYMPPVPSLSQQAAALLAGTVAISSTSTPMLDGSYTVTPDDQAHISVEVQSLMLNGTFADGASTVAWPDASGTLHSFSVAEFKAFATAVGGFVAACLKCQNGASTTLPSAALTIA